jgi:hypothetical protein
MRKELLYTAQDGRDKGKQFIITEMAARPAHKWATRALFALITGGVEIPENVMDMGMAGLASIGIQSLNGISIEKAEPLLDELLTCVTVRPDPNRPEVVRNLFDADVEEPITYFKLQKEAIMLHLDFSIPDAK